MTLHTRLRIHESADLATVFDLALADVVAASDPNAPTAWTESPDGLARDTLLGQGLAALMGVRVGPDGGELPRDDHPEWAEPEEDYDGLDHDPHACVEVDWDTAYGYQDEHGGCSALHGRFVARLGAWAEAQGMTWPWFNEYRGEWHTGRDGLEQLLADGAEADRWFRGTVLPAIALDLIRKES